MHDRLFNGRSFRGLTVMDEFSRSGLALEAAYSFPRRSVVKVLDDLGAAAVAPRVRRSARDMWERMHYPIATQPSLEEGRYWNRDAENLEAFAFVIVAALGAIRFDFALWNVDDPGRDSSCPLFQYRVRPAERK